MTKTLDQWMKDGDYLPPALRDFHDQKDLFKAIAPMLRRYGEKAPGHHTAIKETTWVDLHMLTIDVFLWFMAQHGYTLQPLPKAKREALGCRDLNERVAAEKAERDAASAAALKSLFAQAHTKE